MKTKYIEQSQGNDRKYILLHNEGKVYRVLKVAEDIENKLVKFFLFGGIELDFKSSKIVMKEDKNYRLFFI
jgi:hypothetical protein